MDDDMVEVVFLIKPTDNEHRSGLSVDHVSKIIEHLLTIGGTMTQIYFRHTPSRCPGTCPYLDDCGAIPRST